MSETYKYHKTRDGHKIQVESAVRDGKGKNIENSYVKHNTYDKTLRVGLSDNLFTDQGPLIDARAAAQEGDVYPDKANNAKGTGTFFPYGENDLVTVENGNETIEKVYGNSYVKNQLVKVSSITTAGLTFTYVNDTTLDISGTRAGYVAVYFNEIPVYKGHKYYFYSDKLSNIYLMKKDGSALNYIIKNSILTLSADSQNVDISIQSAVDMPTGEVVLKLIDLTQWFGTGNEITDIPTLTRMFSEYIPYNEGTMVDAEDFIYSSSGINQWDEEWTTNYVISPVNGQELQTTIKRITTVNYIPIIPNTQYYIRGVITYSFCWYDINKNFIGAIYPQNVVVTSPNNAYYCRFSAGSAMGEIYNHDIQICLHYTDTEVESIYHPYEAPATKEIKFYGGKGRSAGNVRDEVDYVAKKRIKRVGKSLLKTGGTWLMLDVGGTNYFFRSNIGQKVGTENVISNKYATSPVAVGDANFPDKVITGWGGAGISIWVRDSSYNSVNDFVNSLSDEDVFNYELATPVEEDITDPEELNNTIPCNDYGIESKSDGVICGMKVQYQLNPLRTIFNNKAAIEQLKQRVSDLEDEVESVVKLYKHTVSITDSENVLDLVVISSREEEYASVSDLQDDFTGKNIISVSGTLNNQDTGNECVLNFVYPKVSGTAMFGVALLDAQDQSVRCLTISGTVEDNVEEY